MKRTWLTSSCAPEVHFVSLKVVRFKRVVDYQEIVFGGRALKLPLDRSGWGERELVRIFFKTISNP